jgi:hypothetical protein
MPAVIMRTLFRSYYYPNMVLSHCVFDSGDGGARWRTAVAAAYRQARAVGLQHMALYDLCLLAEDKSVRRISALHQQLITC